MVFSTVPDWHTAYLRPTAHRPEKLILTAWQAACPDFCWCVHRVAPCDLRPLRINPVEDVHPVAGDPPGLHAMTTCVRTLGIYKTKFITRKLGII